MERDMLSIAAEFAVASELARRNVYAQPTFGHLKRTDLLILGKGRPLRIEVKGKQAASWPNCKGIPDNNAIMVLVDFAGKADKERPDFYVLTLDDWDRFVDVIIQRHPDKGIERDSDHCPVWRNQTKGGKPYKGSGIEVRDVAQHKEKWEKITRPLE